MSLEFNLSIPFVNDGMVQNVIKIPSIGVEKILGSFVLRTHFRAYSVASGTGLLLWFVIVLFLEGGNRGVHLVLSDVKVLRITDRTLVVCLLFNFNFYFRDIQKLERRLKALTQKVFN